MLCGVRPLPPGACTVCRVLLRCGCTKGSHVKSKCMKAALFCLVLYYVLANTPMESKCVKANLNFCGSLIVAILSGSEFQSFIVLGKTEFL